MRVLLISLNQERKPFLAFPLGVAYIAEALERNGHTVRVFDNAFKSDPLASLQDEVNKFRPAMIGLSLRNLDNTSYTAPRFYLPEYSEIVDFCKRNAKAVIMGGSGFSLVPEAIMNFFNLDYGIIGEGEHSIVCFAEAVEGRYDFSQCPGLIYKKGPTYKINPPKLIEDLDTIPLPDFRLLDTAGYLLNNNGKSPCNILTKRGCNLNCIYCSYPVKEGRVHRLHSPRLVVDRMEMIKKRYGIESFSFADSVFNNPLDHAVSICTEIINRKLDIRWSGYINPKFITKEFAYLMKKSGCETVELGVDALEPTMLQSLRKGFTIDDIKTAMGYLKEEKLVTCLFLLFGWMGENENTIKTSLINLEELNPDSAYMKFGIRIYPNTGAYDRLISEGLITAETDLMRPYYFVSEKVKDTGLDIIVDFTKHHKNWFIPTQ